MRYWNGTGVNKRNTASADFVNGNCASLGSDLVTIRNVVVIVNLRGINDLPAVVPLRSAGVDVRSIGLGILVGSNRLVFKEVWRGSRAKVIGSNAENLSGVDVVAVLVDIGVVVLQPTLGLETMPVEKAYGKLGRIESVRRLNPITGITGLNNVATSPCQPLVLSYRSMEDIRGCAVGAIRTQADRLTGHQIAAAGVNGGVDGHKLVPGYPSESGIELGKLVRKRNVR